MFMIQNLSIKIIYEMDSEIINAMNFKSNQNQNRKSIQRNKNHYCRRKISNKMILFCISTAIEFRHAQ